MTSTTPIPPDDGLRQLTVVTPEDDTLPHLAVVGDTYTILISGEDTAGRYALIDMLIPAGGGPPPHRHDFEEMFQILDGEVEVTGPYGKGPSGRWEISHRNGVTEYRVRRKIN